MEKIYTADEIVRHKHKKSLWIVLHGNVYDITKFHKQHPGGEELLLDLGGRDGTKCFDSIGHTIEANKIKDGLKIGKVEEGAILQQGPTSDQLESNKSTPIQEDEKQETKNTLFYVLTIAIVIYAFLMHYIWF